MPQIPSQGKGGTDAEEEEVQQAQDAQLHSQTAQAAAVISELISMPDAPDPAAPPAPSTWTRGTSGEPYPAVPRAERHRRRRSHEQVVRDNQTYQEEIRANRLAEEQRLGLVPGDGAGGIRAAGAGGAELSPPQEPTPRQDVGSIPPQDHRIAQEFPASPIERWDANIRAIRVVKQLEAKSRHATPEEQRSLALFSGFGDSGFEPAFSYSRYADGAWQRRREELEGLVTPEELQGIRDSRNTAFYTTTPVIQAMWQSLVDMGAADLDRPKILEPSAGSGRFLGLQPAAIAARSERTAIEKDPLTAKVLRHTYPEAKTYNAGFEEAPTPDNHYDIAISNVPFGDLRIFDPEFQTTGRRHLTRYINNYFFAKALDKVRPGGVIAFITSHGTLDAPGHESTRRYLADRADLLGAVRLPDDAFPDTQVVTDIVYFRKRAEGEPAGDDSWVETRPMDVGYRTLPVNLYYHNNPGKVLGKHHDSGSMYGRGDSYTVKSDGSPLAPALQREIADVVRGERIERVPDRADRLAQHLAGTGPMEKPTAPRREAARYVVEDGKLMVRQGDQLRRADLAAPVATRVAALVDLRDTARKLLDQEKDGTDNNTVEETRSELNDKYDAYVGRFQEAVNTPENRKILTGGPDDSLLFALENYDQDAECWQPARLFEHRMIGAPRARRIDTPQDAMRAVRNESGALDFTRMGELLGRDADDVRDALERDGEIIKTPEGTWVGKDEYLAGDVRAKLKIAEFAARNDPRFNANVEALRAVQPPDVEPENIGTPLGSPWVGADVVNRWIDETFRPYYGSEWVKHIEEGEAFVGRNESGKSTKQGATGKGGWVVTNKLALPSSTQAEWGVPGMAADKILLKALRGEQIRVTGRGGVFLPEMTAEAQQKAREMQTAFDEWVWQDPARAELLTERFNVVHNANVPRRYDGSRLEFPGMSLEWQRKLRPLQRDAIARGIEDGTMLLGHEVGFGKSASMVATAMERKRLGLADKAVFVVPKATHEQFASDFMKIYPGARVLAPDSSDFSPANRQRLIAQVATGDWDGVILSSEQFQSIPVSPKTELGWVQKQRDELRAVMNDLESGSRSQKEVDKKIKNYTVRMQQLLSDIASHRDAGTVFFEDLGVDTLYVDEADRYKNLPFATNMGGSRGGLKGLPQSESQRAWDMYMKVRHLQDKTGKRPDGRFAKGGVVFATGTPIANTIAEVWTMMRYLQPDEMERRGVSSFDAWAKTYGKIREDVEITPVGNTRPVQRFARFVNGPSLSNLFQNVTDVRVADEEPDMQAVRPRMVDENGEEKRIAVIAPASDELRDYMSWVAQRAEQLGQVDPREDNMLKILSDARKATLDMRMVDPYASYNPQGKVPLAANNIARIYKEEAERKGTQLVFLDLGTPKATDDVGDRETAPDEQLTDDEQSTLKDVYRTLRSELVAKGIPDEQIAFIHDYKTPEAREGLFAQIREGDVRVLVGSTDKAGLGVNVQNHAAALHHIDAPWRPRDIEQREGRIIRQGNQAYGPILDEETGKQIAPGRGVKIYTYATEIPGIDAFMWQTIQSKAAPIKYLMRREPPPFEFEDTDAFTMSIGEIKALASGDPMVMRQVELKQKVDQGRTAARGFSRSQQFARQQQGQLQSQIQRWCGMLPALQEDAAHVEALPEKAPFAATIGRASFAKRLEASEAFAKALAVVPYGGQPRKIGEYKGFDVVGYHGDQGYQVGVQHPDRGQEYSSTYIDRSEVAPAGVMARLDNVVKGIPERARGTQAKLEEGQRTYEQYGLQSQRGFSGGEELAYYERQLKEVEARLADHGLDPDLDVMTDYQGVAQPAAPAAPPAPPPEPAAYNQPGLSMEERLRMFDAQALGEPNEPPAAPAEPTPAETVEEQPPTEPVESARERLDAVDAANAADPTLAGDDDAYEAAYQEYQSARYAEDPTLGDKSLADIIAEEEELSEQETARRERQDALDAGQTDMFEPQPDIPAGIPPLPEPPGQSANDMLADAQGGGPVLSADEMLQDAQEEPDEPEPTPKPSKRTKRPSEDVLEPPQTDGGTVVTPPAVQEAAEELAAYVRDGGLFDESDLQDLVAADISSRRGGARFAGVDQKDVYNRVVSELQRNPGEAILPDLPPSPRARSGGKREMKQTISAITAPVLEAPNALRVTGPMVAPRAPSMPRVRTR